MLGKGRNNTQATFGVIVSTTILGLLLLLSLVIAAIQSSINTQSVYAFIQNRRHCCRAQSIVRKTPILYLADENYENDNNANKKNDRRKNNSADFDDDAVSYSDRINVLKMLRNYFKERQIRKDAEELRFEVQRREEERIQQLEKDAEELRLEVQRRERERYAKLQEYKKKTIVEKQKRIRKKHARKIVSTIEISDEIQKQGQTNLGAEKNRNKTNNNNSNGKENKIVTSDSTDADDESSSSKSRRLKDFVGSAQKAVSGVFEQITKSNEEWIVVAPKTRISPGEIVAITVCGIDILLVASKDGSSLHCVENSCPHLGTPLEVGTLERRPIESSFAVAINDKIEDSSIGNFFGNDPGTYENINDIDSSENLKVTRDSTFFRENDISRMLKQDGCEDCIVCPLHKTAFALETGEVRGEWCPYPPVIGKLTGAIKQQSNLPVFDVRTRGKNIEVRLNTPVTVNVRDNDNK